MKIKILSLVMAALLVLSCLAGCGAQPEAEETPAPVEAETAETEPTAEPEPESTDEPEAEPTAESEPDTAGQVATAADMATPVEVLDEDMEPIYGASIQDGVYDITVDSSSSMFNIVACTLTVEDGQMTAVMTMGGTGYLYVYMGTGEEAVSADEADYIPFVEDEDGAHTYTVPVEALDAGIDCAAYSKTKEMWYDRTLVFRADSLPTSAFADGVIATAESLGLADGSYTVDVMLSGGSGRAYVESPALLVVEDGAATATVVWSSDKYDYMKVDDVRYELVNTEGNSTFEIPVLGFDFNMPVLADTIAMSTPHEIEYTLYFDSASIEPQP